ncbi:MAG TPA: alpha/beta fold hydrolase, partial [Pyrinomonadaceae bacterium]|nr:alpha/beta fold hydrolase [Pyrinomonadaceae bacterium]
TDGSRDNPFEIKLPKSEGNSYFRGLKWAADNRSLIIDRNDKDTKRRQLFYIHNAGGKDEQQILVIEETDDKWQASLSAIFEPNPKDPAQLLFCSEKDGYNHIYLATLEKNAPANIPPTSGGNPTDAGYSGKVDIKPTTRGRWQVEWAKWLPGGDQIVYLVNRGPGNTSERRFVVITSNGTEVELPSVGRGGMLVSPQMDETQQIAPVLIYSRSQWNAPDDVYSQKICLICEGANQPRQLSATVPESFKALVPTIPQFVDIPSRDNKQIKAKVYLPAGHDRKKKYPMVIFVHGAGYLQNTINGWNNYYREFMFNELLAQKGYVVLDIDYRGSAGYGREWRTDVYDFLGGKDYDDHIDAIDFMIKNYGIDAAKVGVYGGSYGGFMAEMLAFRNPEKVAAAAALRPVADWKNYYASSPVYTAQRLGYPDKNPEAYKRSSPISYADGLKTHLLILHGIVDDNVHVEDSMQLTEKLIRLGKTQYFEEQFYPAENHGFVRPESWTDEYERILTFFERYLR